MAHSTLSFPASLEPASVCSPDILTLKIIGESNVVAVFVQIGEPAMTSFDNLNPWCRPITLATIDGFDDLEQQILWTLILPHGHEPGVTPIQETCTAQRVAVATSKTICSFVN
jgi:hypothetical protein